MDHFDDDIAAMALGSTTDVSLEEAAEAYEKEGVRRMIKLWKRFAVNLPSPANKTEATNPFQSVPELNWVKAYLVWRVKTGTPRLGNRITIRTLQKEFEQLRRSLRLALDFTWANKDIAAMKRFINNLSKTQGASTSIRQKTVAYVADSDYIQFYVWNCSEREYIHPRMIVQFSFLLDIISVWGLRTGEITESSSHRGSNEGIHYGDITLSLAPCQGEMIYQIKIALRNRKFCRNDEGKVKNITLREHMDPTQRFRCPVRKFLALALADDVFVTQKTPEDFETRYVCSSANSRSFDIKRSKKDVPVFRKIEGKRVSETAIMTAGSSNALIKEICESCGYMEPVTTYTFRRGVANKVEGKASQKGTKEVLSHKGDRTWHSYAAPTIGTDAQAIAYDEEGDTVYNEFSQSIAFTRDWAAPKPPNSSLGTPSLPSSEVLKAVADAHPGSRLDMIMRKARSEQLKIDRKKYSEKMAREKNVVPNTLNNEPSVRDVVSVIEKEVSLDEETLVHTLPEPTINFKHMLKYNHLQARVIQTLWSKEDFSLADCVRPLMALANPEPYRLLYSHPVQPPTKEGTCPYCSRSMGKLKMPFYALHLLDCYCILHKAQFCFDCAAFTNEPQGKAHNCPSFDPAGQVYGVVTWRGLLIREGRCPFSSDRWCQERRWRNTQLLKEHIETHLYGLPEDALCPHRNCTTQGMSRKEMRDHLHVAHKIYLVSRKTLFAESQGQQTSSLEDQDCAGLKRKRADNDI